MRIIFLGGTSFVGRHIVNAALAAGHEVILANRGVTNPSVFSGLQRVHVDRNMDSEALSGLDADIAIDTSGFTADSVRRSARALADCVRKYIFMSSIDAYDLRQPHISEKSESKIFPAGASTSERVPELYGAQKVLSEQILVEELGASRVLVVRAGLMCGPYDATGRLTYWPVRCARGGDILVPEGRSMPLQVIDARDMAAWTIGAMQRDLSGRYNVVGAPGSVTFGDLLDACASFTPSDARFHWASSAFLQSHDVTPWVEMPLWLPEDPEYAGLRSIRNDRAFAAGLRPRPLAETVADILTEYRARPDGELRAGLSPPRESDLLRLLARP